MDNIDVNLIRVCVRVLLYCSALKKNEVKKVSEKQICLESRAHNFKKKKNPACFLLYSESR